MDSDGIFNQQDSDNCSYRVLLRVCWPKVMSNLKLWFITGQSECEVQIRKRKGKWMGTYGGLSSTTGIGKAGLQKGSWQKNMTEICHREIIIINQPSHVHFWM